MLKGFQNSPELNFSIPEHKEAMLMAFKEVDQEKGQDYPLIIGGDRQKNRLQCPVHQRSARPGQLLRSVTGRQSHPDRSRRFPDME